MSGPDAIDGRYIYCIIEGEHDTRFDVEAVGREETPVFTIAGHGWSVVASARQPEEMDATRRNMLSHTKVLEHVMAAHDILPVSFGTIAPDEASVLRNLRIHRHAFRDLMAAIGGHVELGVRATWKDDVIWQEILAENDDLRAMRDRLQGTSAEATWSERVELGRRVEAVMQARREADAAMIAARLDPLAAKVEALKPAGERGILNRAFLVPREAEAKFDAAMEALDAEQGARMEFRYVGPVPPYNFTTLRARWAEPASETADAAEAAGELATAGA